MAVRGIKIKATAKGTNPMAKKKNHKGTPDGGTECNSRAASPVTVDNWNDVDCSGCLKKEPVADFSSPPSSTPQAAPAPPVEDPVSVDGTCPGCGGTNVKAYNDQACSPWRECQNADCGRRFKVRT